jgi:Cu-processing system permease protein
LLLLLLFKEYPLEKLSLSLTLFNPIDLARILIILKLDISAMLGYTGAVLQKFLGSGMGSVLILITLLLWIILPFWRILHLSGKKDF